MKLDPGVVAKLTARCMPQRYLRLTPLRFEATPLGLGYGETRFASPSHTFRVLYFARSLVTGLAETVVRDRYVGRTRRWVSQDEVEAWGMVEVSARMPLTLLDLQGHGCVALGVPTNIVRGKAHGVGRRFSEALYGESRTSMGSSTRPG